jgi:hypothetical protein
MDIFDELLKGLSPHLGLNLYRDTHNSCSLLVGEKLKVHIAPDNQGHLIIYSFLEEIGPGKFREDVLKEGLKANKLLLAGGVLGYSGKKGFLTLQQIWPIEISPSSLFEAFIQFVEYAMKWQTALSQGKTTPLMLAAQSKQPSIFELKP